MTTETEQVLKWYKELEQIYVDGVNKGMPLTTKVNEDGETLGEALERVQTHIHRLETNHADCKEPCCVACPAGK